MLLEGNYDSDQRPVHLCAFDSPLFTSKELEAESTIDISACWQAFQAIRQTLGRLKNITMANAAMIRK
jgi:hypothetical protein